jgi:hypothetical protein
VVLADSRFALAGPTYAVGAAAALLRHVERRSRTVDAGDRGWLVGVATELRALTGGRRSATDAERGSARRL